MHYVHPALMAALFLAGLLVASRGGAARMVRLREAAEPLTLRRHRLPAALWAALVAAGYGGGLLTVYWLLPFLLARSLHFVMGTVLLGLLATVVLVAVLAHRGVRWALHAHPLLATTLLILYLVQAMLGLQLLGWAPLPPEPRGRGVCAVSRRLPPADVAPPLAVNPEPDESARLKPFYAICPKSEAIPTTCWIVEI